MRMISATTALWLALVAVPGAALSADDASKTAAQTNTYQTSRMIGTNIKNMSGETLGEVDDVLVAPDGAVRGVVADVGGFLGMGERHVLINWTALKMQRSGDDMMITANIDKKTLEKQPAYEWKAKGMSPTMRSNP